MGGSSSVPLGSRASLNLSQLRSLDLLMMSSRASMMGIPIREEIARQMSNRVASFHTPPEVSVDRFDRLGIITIDESAYNEGITYETVKVIAVMSYGIRIITLREALEQSEAAVVRPLMFPGESKRSTHVVPPPMKIVAAPGQASVGAVSNPSAGGGAGPAVGRKQHRRTNSGVLFSNTYSLPEEDIPDDPLNSAVHGDAKIAHRRELHTQLRALITPFCDKSMDDPLVLGHFANVFKWFTARLLEAAPSHDESLRIEEVAHVYCRRMAQGRKDVFVQEEIQKRKLAKRLNELTELEAAHLFEDRLSGRSSSSSSSASRLAPMAKSTSTSMSSSTQANHGVDPKAIPVEAFGSQNVHYGDLVGLLAVVAQDKALRCTFNDEEMHQIIEMFLDPRRDDTVIGVQDLIRMWIASLHRNTDARKVHAQLLSGAIISHLYQDIGVLPTGEEYLFHVRDYFQNSRKAQASLKGALLGREHILNLPSDAALAVLDAATARQREVAAAQKKAEAEAARALAERKKKHAEAEAQRKAEAEAKRAAAEEARKRDLAGAITRQIQADAEAKAALERKLQEEEVERNRLQKQREMEARKRKKEAERKARQHGMTAIDRLLDIDDDKSDEDDEEDADTHRQQQQQHLHDDDIDQRGLQGIRSVRGKTFSFREDGSEAKRPGAAGASGARKEALENDPKYRAQVAESLGPARPVLLALAAADLPPAIAYNGPFATMCAIWSMNPPSMSNVEPELLAYTPPVMSSLSPSYQAACMVAFSPEAYNMVTITCYLAFKPEDLGVAPVIGTAKVDILKILQHPVGVGQPPLVFPLYAVDGNSMQVGRLEVLQFTEDMGDLVLYLGGESAIFSGDNGAVACTYNGLAALLAAAGEDLQQCLDVIKALEDSGARFVSLNSLSVAVAQQVNNGQFPGPVRNALLSYLSRSACPLLPTAIDNASPAHMDKLLRAIPDPDKLFTRLALLDAADHSSSSIDDLAAVLADPKIASKFHPESKSSASDDEDDVAVTSALTLVEATLPRLLATPKDITAADVLKILSKTPVGGDIDRLRARVDLSAKSEFLYQDFDALVAAFSTL